MMPEKFSSQDTGGILASARTLDGECNLHWPILHMQDWDEECADVPAHLLRRRQENLQKFSQSDSCDPQKRVSYLSAYIRLRLFGESRTVFGKRMGLSAEGIEGIEGLKNARTKSYDKLLRFFDEQSQHGSEELRSLYAEALRRSASDIASLETGVHRALREAQLRIGRDAFKDRTKGFQNTSGKRTNGYGESEFADRKYKGSIGSFYSNLDLLLRTVDLPNDSAQRLHDPLFRRLQIGWIQEVSRRSGYDSKIALLHTVIANAGIPLQIATKEHDISAVFGSKSASKHSIPTSVLQNLCAGRSVPQSVAKMILLWLVQKNKISPRYYNKMLSINFGDSHEYSCEEISKEISVIGESSSGWNFSDLRDHYPDLYAKTTGKSISDFLPYLTPKAIENLQQDARFGDPKFYPVLAERVRRYLTSRAKSHSWHLGTIRSRPLRRIYTQLESDGTIHKLISRLPDNLQFSFMPTSSKNFAREKVDAVQQKGTSDMFAVQSFLERTHYAQNGKCTYEVLIGLRDLIDQGNSAAITVAENVIESYLSSQGFEIHLTKESISQALYHLHSKDHWNMHLCGYAKLLANEMYPRFRVIQVNPIASEKDESSTIFEENLKCTELPPDVLCIMNEMNANKKA